MSFRALLISNSYSNDSSGMDTLPNAESDGENVATWLLAQLGADVGKCVEKLPNANALKMRIRIQTLGKKLQGMREKPLV